MTIDWLLIKVRVDRAVRDLSPYTSALIEAGCGNTLENDADNTVTGSLPASDEATMAIRELIPRIKAMGADIVIENFQGKDWAELWKMHYEPFPIGERFMIVPTWKKEVEETDRIILRLDPGQAFGTGEHPTTRLCLELLEREKVEGQTWLDIGTGTGVLAIALKKMGCEDVFATDIEPTAIFVAQRNCKQNGVEVHFEEGDGLEMGFEVDLFDGVVSNIISATILRLCPDIKPILKFGGVWLVSGIYKPNFDEIEKTATKWGFTLEMVLERDDWIAARFRLPAA
jgi:ribosomal protein L11 methyltransferase